MERTKKQEALNPVSKLHIIYGSIIMFLAVSFSITMFTMKSSYEEKLAQAGVSSGMSAMPEDHPPMQGDAAAQQAGTAKPQDGGGMPSGGGMPPFLKKMLTEYKDALAKNPKDIKALTGLANMYYDSGQYEKAIGYYEQAVAVDSKNTALLSDLGTCYFYVNKNDEALKTLQAAVKVDEKNVNARFNLGIVYKSQGKKAEAKAEWLEMMKHLKTDDEKKMLQAKIDELEKM